MTVTIITMYRGWDAETFVQVVDGPLDTIMRDEWKKSHSCGRFHCDDKYNCDEHNDMWFREMKIKDCTKVHKLMNVDGDMGKNK